MTLSTHPRLSMLVVLIAAAFFGTGCVSTGSSSNPVPPTMVAGLKGDTAEARHEVAEAFAELEEMTVVSKQQLETQYQAYQRSSEKLRSQIATLDRSIADAEAKLNAKIDEMESKVNEEDSDFGLAYEIVKQVTFDPIAEMKQAKNNLFGQARAMYGELGPLLEKLDAKALELKTRIESDLIEPGSELARQELAEVKLKVDKAIDEADATLDSINANSGSDA